MSSMERFQAASRAYTEAHRTLSPHGPEVRAAREAFEAAREQRLRQSYTLYVPAAAALPTGRRILPGSAIVGETLGDNTRILIHYEGNAYGAVNLNVFADKADTAAGRLATLYPTVACAILSADELREAGSFDPFLGVVTVFDADALANWMGVDGIEARELLTSGGASSRRRAVLEALRNHPSQDPGTREFLQRERRRLGL
jgi:hypothetical protein